jgi:hypothetical protein
LLQFLTELQEEKHLDRFRAEYEKLHRAVKKAHGGYAAPICMLMEVSVILHSRTCVKSFVFDLSVGVMWWSPCASHWASELFAFILKTISPPFLQIVRNGCSKGAKSLQMISRRMRRR